MGTKLKAFRLPEKTVSKLESFAKEKRAQYSSEAVIVNKALEIFFTSPPIPEAPKTIPAFEIPSEILEKAKEVNTCPHYEVYPSDPKSFVKCHALEKPRIKASPECETCNQKRTLYNEIIEMLNALSKKKTELENELKATETSLRTVGSEYQRLKRELEILQKQRAKFGEAQPVSPDPMLIQRIKELEAERDELRKTKPIVSLAPAPEIKVPYPQFIFLSEGMLEEKEVLECMAKCENWNPVMSMCPYPPYEPPEKCHFFKALPSPRFEIPKEPKHIFDTEEILIETYEPLFPKAKAKYHQLIEEARKEGKRLTEDLLDHFSEIACK